MNSLALPIKARGRPEIPISISLDREICLDDLARANVRTFVPKPLEELRAIHHRMAMYLAHGYSQRNVAAMFGRSESRLSILTATPSFKNLVNHYRDECLGQDTIQARTQGDQMQEILHLALDTFHERLEDTPEQFTNGQLLSAISDFSDRLGPSKKQANFNVNVDLADRLGAARRAMGGPSLERLGDNNPVVGERK